MRRTCANEARAAADDPPLPKRFGDFEGYVRTRLTEARAFRSAVDLPRFPARFAAFHRRLLDTARREVTLLEKLDKAAARVDHQASSTLAADFGRLDRRRDEDAAWLGLPDCVRAPGSDPALAYTAAPRRGARSGLSRRAFRSAIAGVCSDSSARSKWGHLMIRDYPSQSDARRAEADRRFSRQIRLRQTRLLDRLGLPPSRAGRPECAGPGA